MDIERELYELSAILKVTAYADSPEIDKEDILTVLQIVSRRMDDIYVYMISTYLNAIEKL